jgi:hypothetical protein
MRDRHPNSVRPATLIWVFGILFAALGYAFEARVQLVEDDPIASDNSVTPIFSQGGSASDSNNRMIAVTGMDLTGQSVLYLVDTISYQLAVYQASGGSASTQGIKFVGARNIELDFQLDGFNDKSKYSFKELEREFADSAQDE